MMMLLRKGRQRAERDGRFRRMSVAHAAALSDFTLYGETIQP
jgi:hypothetical protein